MKLSTRGRYGASAMLELAVNYGKPPVQLGEIARRQRISEKYLERVMAALVSAGLARSRRGQRGGFQLAKEPGAITMSDIVQAVEGSLAPVPCVDDAGICTRSAECVTRDVWDKMKEAVVNVLESVSLADMVKRHDEKTAGSQVSGYQI